MEEWKETNNALVKTFEFKSFEDAIHFMYTCVSDINTLNHHPEWHNIYNKVFVKLTTHDEGNKITQKDRKLAEILDSRYCPPA